MRYRFSIWGARVAVRQTPDRHPNYFFFPNAGAAFFSAPGAAFVAAPGAAFSAPGAAFSAPFSPDVRGQVAAMTLAEGKAPLGRNLAPGLGRTFLSEAWPRVPAALLGLPRKYRSVPCAAPEAVG